MPTTRRRRANPPEQPEQMASVTASPEQASAPVENTDAEQKQTEAVQAPAPEAESQNPVAGQGSTENATPEAAQSQVVAEGKIENAAPSAPTPAPPFRHTTRNHVARNTHTQFTPVTPPTTPVFPHDAVEHTNTLGTPPTARPERLSRTDRVERQQQQLPERPEYPPAIEGGRRTARGELFRRPPQQPQPLPQPLPTPVASPQLQPPSHEITLPLGNLLHLAYNPGYTGSEEARSQLLQQLAAESKAGGRARCWSCGSLAIVYDRWNTRSKTFGDVGVAFCEICGVWSVL
jgi:hypothetical protein